MPAVRVHAELGMLDATRRGADRRGCRPRRGRELDDKFNVDVLPDRPPALSNMNANEVIAALAGEDIHANARRPKWQSSNGRCPSGVNLAALAAEQRLLLRSASWSRRYEPRRGSSTDVVRRPHSPDGRVRCR